MSYLRYVCLFADSGVQHILYCVFALCWFADSGVQHILYCVFALCLFADSGVQYILYCVFALCLFAASGVQHILYCVFALFWRFCSQIVMNYLAFQPFNFEPDEGYYRNASYTLNIYVFIRLVPGVPNVVSVTGLSIFDCPFGILEERYENTKEVIRIRKSNVYLL